MQDITCSVEDDQYEWIHDSPLNASALLREAIDERRGDE